jgi:hypothetical protein
LYRYDGVATVQFPTSTEPTLGTWTVEAVAAESSAGAATSSSSVAAFTLDRYVLPTFEVKVAPDSPAVYKGQTSPVTGLVTGAYTYGEPLAGGSTFTVNVWQRSGGGGGGGVGFVGDIAVGRLAAGNAAVSPTQTQQQQYTLVASLAEQALSGGSARYTLDVSSAKINFGYGYGAAPELVLEARVTDGATGATQNGTAVWGCTAVESSCPIIA